ncbi:MAG: biopolymer transporter ExbD [Bacteroidales bacterium]|nr:biopolymer transporter ExbD [Bacteroidales bacterium]MCF8403770.1 biopolymer transporter ExbD [Bacteroidales bacterium]
MAKFRKKGGKVTPGISTASLPDIIFMLLFFFMVTTTMREATLLVKIKPAQATEVQKLEKKSLVDYIYIGPPIKKQLGTDSRIQLNDQFATDIKDIREFVELGRSQREEADRKLITTSLKVHKETKMGIVTDVKQELREVGAFKINYSTAKKAVPKK